MTAIMPTDADVLRALCAGTTDFMLVLDGDGRCVKVLGAQSRFGTAEEVIGKTLHELVDVQLADQHVAVIKQVLHHARLQVLRYSLVFAGQLIWFQATVSPMSNTLALWVARDITEQRALEQAQARLWIFEALADQAVDGIAIAGEDTIITYANTAYRSMTGYGDKIIGMSFLAIFPPAEKVQVLEEALPTVLRTGVWRGTFTSQRPDGSLWTNQISTALLRADENQPPLLAAISRDVSEQQRLDSERSALQEEVIEAQQAALRELSTPLVPIAAGVIAMPLVGAIDSRRAQQVMETLLEGITAQQAAYAIIDVTGVRVVDTQVASALLRVAQATKLLGAQVILTGISPEVAQTLVQLGADLSGIVVRSTVQSGITYALGAK
ncbi:MAG: PAS domain S-box protein [Chloroflexales bacterium]|nr:PAS domain S-box protein [Chloroflexales bacterium]